MVRFLAEYLTTSGASKPTPPKQTLEIQILTGHDHTDLACLKHQKGLVHFNTLFRRVDSNDPGSNFIAKEWSYETQI